MQKEFLQAYTKALDLQRDKDRLGKRHDILLSFNEKKINIQNVNLIRLHLIP